MCEREYCACLSQLLLMRTCSTCMLNRSTYPVRVPPFPPSYPAVPLSSSPGGGTTNGAPVSFLWYQHIPVHDTDEELLAQIPNLGTSTTTPTSRPAATSTGVRSAVSPRGPLSSNGDSPATAVTAAAASSLLSPLMNTGLHQLGGVGPLSPQRPPVGNGDGRGLGSPRRVMRPVNLSDHHGVRAGSTAVVVAFPGFSCRTLDREQQSICASISVRVRRFS